MALMSKKAILTRSEQLPRVLSLFFTLIVTKFYERHMTLHIRATGGSFMTFSYNFDALTTKSINGVKQDCFSCMASGYPARWRKVDFGKVMLDEVKKKSTNKLLSYLTYTVS
jgi:hypothetical protein